MDPTLWTSASISGFASTSRHLWQLNRQNIISDQWIYVQGQHSISQASGDLYGLTFLYDPSVCFDEGSFMAFSCFIAHHIKLIAEFIRRMPAACQWFYISLLHKENSQVCEEGLIIYPCTCPDVSEASVCMELVHLYILALLYIHDIACVQSCWGVWNIMDIPSQTYQ